MRIPAPLIGILVLTAYAAAAVVPCSEFPTLRPAPSEHEVSVKSHDSEEAWCRGGRGYERVKSPPILLAKCGCGCGDRTAGLAGPVSLDDGLKRSRLQPTEPDFFDDHVRAVAEPRPAVVRPIDPIPKPILS